MRVQAPAALMINQALQMHRLWNCKSISIFHRFILKYNQCFLRCVPQNHDPELWPLQSSCISMLYVFRYNAVMLNGMDVIWVGRQRKPNDKATHLRNNSTQMIFSPFIHIYLITVGWDKFRSRIFIYVHFHIYTPKIILLQNWFQTIATLKHAYHAFPI